MAGTRERSPRVTYESRLLLLTIAVCVVVLLLLSRLRFPETPPMVDTSIPPLERLASRVSTDALTADVERLEALIGPGLLVVQSRPPAVPSPRRLADVLGEAPAWDDARHVVALRLDGTTAVAALHSGAEVAASTVADAPTAPVSTLGLDPIRHIGLLSVPEAPTRPVAPLSLGALRRPLWVIAVEATQAGFTLRPIQLGRGEPFTSARWPNRLLPLGATTVAPGAFIFTVTGDFVGMAVIDRGALAIADARDVLEVAAGLGTAVDAPLTLGVAVQPLTPALARATRATRGVIIAEVDADGPAHGELQPGDVITALDDEPVDDPDRFLLAVAALPPAPLTVRIVRAGSASAVQVTPARATTAESSAVGVTFARTPGDGTRVVEATSTTGLVGSLLKPGDIVVAAGSESDPTPVQIRRELEGADARAGVVFTLRREGQQFVVVVYPPVGPDVP